MSNPGPIAERGQRFTWSDYRSWADDRRWELIEGVAYAMSPAPSITHQEVTLRLSSRLEQQLSGRPRRPFVAPTDAKLSEPDVVQQNILAVCGPSKIPTSHIEGTPDLIVEVLSPGTSARDLRDKNALYERAGVREYLVVDPLEHYAIPFPLGLDGYDKGAVFAADKLLCFATLESIEIPLWEVFGLPGAGMANSGDGANA
jgi:Uma2 family endonuclease